MGIKKFIKNFEKDIEKEDIRNKKKELEENKERIYQPSSKFEKEPENWNVWAVVGFACSFIIPVFGLIFCIVALSELKHKNQKGIELAFAGVIISVIGLIIYSIYFFKIFSELQKVLEVLSNLSS